MYSQVIALNYRRSPKGHFERSMFTSKRKSTYRMNVSAFVWTSLGLNQGPPDYETNRMIFHDILSWWSVLNISCLRKNDISFHFIEFLWLNLFVYALFTQNRLIDYWSLWQRTTIVMWKVKFWNYFFVSLVKQTKHRNFASLIYN